MLMKYLCDTNVLLEIVLKRRYTLSCSNFVSSHRKEISITSHAFFSFCIVSEKFQQEQSALELLTYLLEEGMKVIAIPYQDGFSALREKDLMNLDFDDYIQYRAAKDNQLMLVTLDRDLLSRKFAIPVLRPAQVR